MNYLPDAVRHGAQVFTEVDVRHVTRAGNRWAVTIRPLDGGREAFGHAADIVIAADVVVLGAGALGSTEILLRSAARGLPLSGALGTHFSGNGDVLGFSYAGREAVHGVGHGDRPRTGREWVGPTITGVIDVHADDVDDSFVIEEGSIPGAIASLVPTAFAAAASMQHLDADLPSALGRGAVRRPGRPLHDVPGDGPRRRGRADDARRRGPAADRLAGRRRAAERQARHRCVAHRELRARRPVRRQPDVERRPGPSAGHGAPAGRLPDGRDRAGGRRRRPQPRVRRPDRHRRPRRPLRDGRVGDPAVARREPAAHDHRARRACVRAPGSRAGLDDPVRRSGRGARARGAGRVDLLHRADGRMDRTGCRCRHDPGRLRRGRPRRGAGEDRGRVPAHDGGRRRRALPRRSRRRRRWRSAPSPPPCSTRCRSPSPTASSGCSLRTTSPTSST